MLSLSYQFVGTGGYLVERVNHWDTILDSTMKSIHQVIPIELQIEKSEVLNESFTQEEIGVQIGFTGDFPCKLILEGKESMYSSIGEKMFGMPLMGEMLESFSGELGNMIAGNLSTLLSEKGLQVDITPPQTFMGESKVYGFQEAYKVTASIGGTNTMNILFMRED